MNTRHGSLLGAAHANRIGGLLLNSGDFAALEPGGDDVERAESRTDRTGRHGAPGVRSPRPRDLLHRPRPRPLQHPLRVTYEVPSEGWAQWTGAVKWDDEAKRLDAVAITTVTNLVRDGRLDHGTPNLGSDRAWTTSLPGWLSWLGSG